ncbi:hypothetical protein [Pantoea rwandensis]|uniref:hypothetical protein n=1 Tax=Pantoea rwandensis TaxID=1076550 RepID=UPI001301C692|nr:hypothetical protein [Pantoea rwandensis]
MKCAQNGEKLIVAVGHHFMETPEGDYVMAYALPEKINENEMRRDMGGFANITPYFSYK